MQVLALRLEQGIHLIQSDSEKGLYGAHTTRQAVLELADPAGVFS